MPTIYWVEFGTTGRVGIVERPRGGDWLSDEIKQLSDSKVDVLVSCLTPSENEELGLTAEQTTAKERGLGFLAYPIPDRTVPESQMHFLTSTQPTFEVFEGGGSVVAHCRAGIGRSTLMVCSMLIRLGATGPQALDLVSTARGRQVPDTSEQADWIIELAAIVRATQ